MNEVVEAYVTFHLDSGEVDVIPLNEFLENLGVLDIDDDDLDDDVSDESIEESLLDDLGFLIQVFDVELPIRLTVDDRQAEIDLVAGQVHLATPEDLDHLRHLENLMSTERWGEEYESWD